MLKTDKPRRGYWCECWGQDLANPTERPALHASFDAYSAHQADRWVAVALRTITPALSPDASHEAWTWLCEGSMKARAALLRRQPYTGTVSQATTRITWTIPPWSSCPSLTGRAPYSPPAQRNSSPSRQPELQLSLLVQGGSLRSPRAARPPAGPALLSPPRSSPAGARTAHSDQPPDLKEGARCGWGGRLHGFRQPLWGEPLRSWPQRRALPGRFADCPTRHQLTCHDHSLQSSSHSKAAPTSN